jgi:RNA polymerase sigma factor (TIGR02999 family)
MGEVTRILSAIEQGDPDASDELLPLVYDELRRLAGHWIARERPGQTLQATALVHEAYLRLVGAAQPQSWNSQHHFFAAAAEAMRRILIDRARRKLTEKHGGGRRRIDLETVFPACDAPPEAVLAVDEALIKLEQEFPDHAQLVKLRHYAGFTIQHCADALRISPRTAKRRWAFARAFLFSELEGNP